MIPFTNQRRSYYWAILVGLFGLFIWAPTVKAQENELSIRLSRDWGAAIGGRIQGTFSIHASGPDDLARVAFHLDTILLGQDEAAPFRLQFSTDNYPPGQYLISAVGFTSDGTLLTSNVISVTIMSAEESRSSLVRVIGPILIGSVVLTVLLGSISVLSKKKLTPGEPRQYGVAGGALCPKCHRAYPRHLFSPNLVVGKLERCPFCGKWAIVAAASPQQLAAAEEAERAALKEQVADSPISPEEKLRQQLDQSRYDSS